MKKVTMPDWLIRSIKTFVQAFFGILIPEICAILQNPELIADIGKVKAILIPTVCSALAAGICAVWNGITGEQNRLYVRTEANAHLITQIMVADATGEDYMAE